jgi:hypothetical protein
MVSLNSVTTGSTPQAGFLGEVNPCIHGRRKPSKGEKIGVVKEAAAGP